MVSIRTAIRSALVSLLLGLCLCAVAVTASAATFPISGIVSLPGGAPAAGAKVEMVDPYHGHSVVATTTCDSTGKYTLAVRPGKYLVRAASGVMVCYDRTITVDVDENGSVTGQSDAEIKKGCVVHGTVIDKTSGQLVAGARVMDRDGFATETTADGSFTLILPKGRYTITAVKEGYYYPLVGLDVSDQDTTAIMIETKPGGTIKGKVTNEKNEPLSGVGVGFSGTYFDFQRTTTDSNGAYSFPGLDPDARTEICAYYDGYEWDCKDGITFPSGQRETTVDFQLRPIKLRTVSGRVTKTDGSPVKDAEVSYGWSICYAGRKTTRTQDDGSYTLPGVDTTKNLIVVTASGLAPAFKFVEAEISAKIDLQMEPGHWITGAVVDEQGTPLQAVMVCAAAATPEMDLLGFCNSNPYDDVVPNTTTDKDGRFRMENLPAGKVFLTAFARRGFSRVDQAPFQVDKTHTITLASQGQISGTVVAAKDGKSVKEFKIFLDFPRSRRPGDKCSGLSPGLLEHGMSYNSADGKFVLKGLTSGETLRVIAEAPGYLRQAIDRVDVVSTSKVGSAAVTFRLEQASPFEGCVMDARSGKPLEGVLVSLLEMRDRGRMSFYWDSAHESQRPVSARTDDHGRFRFDSVPARRCGVTLEKSGYGRTWLPDIDMAKPLKASLPLAATVSGVAVDVAGNPPTGTYMTIERYNNGRVKYGSATIGPDGKFEFKDLPPGSYRAEMFKASRFCNIKEFRLKEGGEYVIDWNARGESEIAGLVTSGLTPVAGASILIFRLGDVEPCAAGYAGGDGRYRISLNKPGAYNLHFSKGSLSGADSVDSSRIVTVKKGQNSCDLRFPAASVSGRAIDAKTGKPFSNATIHCYTRGTDADHYSTIFWYTQHAAPYWAEERKSRTDKDGRFEIKDLPAAEVRLTITAEDSASAGAAGKLFRLKTDEKKTGVTFKVPQVGSAHIAVLDAKTGKAIPNLYVQCYDESGFPYQPNMGSDRSCSGSSCDFGPKLTAKCEWVFNNLLPGRYRVVPVTDAYLPTSVTFDVKAGKVSSATLKLTVGQKLVFRLKETANNPIVGDPAIGFKLKSLPGNKPVLVDYYGPCWGDWMHFYGALPRTNSLAVPPGEYKLEVQLKNGDSDWALDSPKKLWSGAKTVKVTPGKDTVVEIPWNAK